MLKLVSSYNLIPAQKEAATKIIKNFKNKRFQVLEGLTGTGKTFTVANIIEHLQEKTLILVANKTLAGQLYSEFKKFFPENNVEYYVSNFDYYQPEAYLPEKNLYIDKTSKQNQDLNVLRNKTLRSLHSSKDTIVIASIACIFGQYSPKDFSYMCRHIKVGEKYKKTDFTKMLVQIGYARNDMVLKTGTFRVKGTTIEIMQASDNDAIIVLDLFGDIINSIKVKEYLTNKIIQNCKEIDIFPGSDYVFTYERLMLAVKNIKDELNNRLKFFKDNNRLLEEQRLRERINADVDALMEFGVCSGIENYSAPLEFRKRKETPPTIFDYYEKPWLLVIDESHISIPQVHGMYNNDQNRKQKLVDYGFRLPSALDNRPLNFSEFMEKTDKILFVSATPGEYELDLVNQEPVKQYIRPTGLLDPKIVICPKKNQIIKVISIIKENKKKNERTIILTLTKKAAEELVKFFEEHDFQSYYLHSDLKTLERLIILNKLRKGKLDCIVGINLLREGLDLPEVSSIIILDADATGFLRDYRSLVQMFGRASRNKNGTIYLFADVVTKSMKQAISETVKRRKLQENYNQKNNIIPQTIIKPIIEVPGEEELELLSFKSQKESLSRKNKMILARKIKIEMLNAAKNFEFEKAAKLRDILFELKGEEENISTKKNNLLS